MIEMIAIHIFIIIGIMTGILGGYAFFEWWKVTSKVKPPVFWLALCCYTIGIAGFIFLLLGLTLSTV